MASLRIRRRGSLAGDGIWIDCYVCDDGTVVGHVREPGINVIRDFAFPINSAEFAELMRDFQMGLSTSLSSLPIGAYDCANPSDCRFFGPDQPHSASICHFVEQLLKRLRDGQAETSLDS